MVFLPFSFEGFPCKICCLIVVDLLLFGWLCCWLNCLLNLFLAHDEGKVILEQLHLVVFPNKVVSELGCLEFFLCAKMDDSMIKLNSMNYSTWKRMMEDFLYYKYLYKPIRLKEKPSDTLDDD